MINGVLNVWKEAGFTSHDVVAKLRGILHQKKIGHTGTLDPDATGVLPVCLGKGTRLCDMLTDETKTYEALLHLGIATDTQDMSGTVTAEAPVTVTEEEVRDCIASFVGEQQQVPPMYSALKVNGKKLYELAREGIEIERKARTVHFYEITLCHDIGEKLGCHGCMEQLIRTRVGQFDRNGAHTLDEIAAIVGEGRLSEILVPVDEMFAALRSFATADDHAKKLAENGNPLKPAQIREIGETASGGDFAEDEEFRLYLDDGTFVGIYQYRPSQNLTRPVKLFLERT